jgi:hypothetical protein
MPPLAMVIRNPVTEQRHQSVVTPGAWLRKHSIHQPSSAMISQPCQPAPINAVPAGTFTLVAKR